MHSTDQPAPARIRVDIAALGLDIGVAIDDDELRALVRHLWADCGGRTTDGDQLPIRVTGREPWNVTSDAHTEEAKTLPAAVGAVCSAINLTVARETPLLAVHAAVLQKSGTTIVIPGESGAGKTTLTVALLLQAGWAYGSDEAFALEWDVAATVAYPRPLGVSDWTADKLAAPAGVGGVGERFVNAADLGVAVADDGYRVDHVLLLSRSEPVQAPRLETIHRAEALEVLVQQGFTHYRDPARAIRLLADVIRGARPWRLRYDDPQRAAHLVDHALLSENVPLRDHANAECSRSTPAGRETIRGDVSGKPAGGGTDRCARSRGAFDVADETR